MDRGLDGLEFTVAIGGGRQIDELTVVVNELCDRVEDSPDSPIAVLWLDTISPDDRSWPGRIRIQQVNRWERAVRRLEKLTATSVAVASGVCGGSALDVLLASDYRIAERGLRLLLPVNEDQFWPGMALHRLVNQIGVARARQLVLWGHELTGEQALAFGLVDETTADPVAAVRAAELLLGRVSSTDLAVRRQLMLEAPAASYEQALGAHLAACDRELRRLDRIAATGRRPSPKGTR